MQLCASGPPNDFFLPDCPFNLDNVRQGCNATFGNLGYDASLTRPGWVLTLYGAAFPSASNIVFSCVSSSFLFLETAISTRGAAAAGHWSQRPKEAS